MISEKELAEKELKSSYQAGAQAGLSFTGYNEKK
jgi:hypothetical protein